MRSEKSWGQKRTECWEEMEGSFHGQHSRRTQVCCGQRLCRDMQPGAWAEHSPCHPQPPSCHPRPLGGISGSAAFVFPPMPKAAESPCTSGRVLLLPASASVAPGGGDRAPFSTVLFPFPFPALPQPRPSRPPPSNELLSCAALRAK